MILRVLNWPSTISSKTILKAAWFLDTNYILNWQHKWKAALRWVAIFQMQWFRNKKHRQVLQWKARSGVGSFQDEYGEGHWDTGQRAQPLNDPITGFEMDPGAEFRNLKWKGWGEAILQQMTDSKKSSREKRVWKMLCEQLLNAPGDVDGLF